MEYIENLNALSAVIAAECETRIIRDHQFDRGYRGPDGIDLGRWGAACERGMPYEDKGPVMPDQKGAIRKFGRGRPWRNARRKVRKPISQRPSLVHQGGPE